MSGYMVQVRTSGRGQWAGMSTQGRWVPACVGALNETGRSDAFASTFDTDKEAMQIMREMREGGGADAYTDFRVEKVPDGDPPTPAPGPTTPPRWTASRRC